MFCVMVSHDFNHQLVIVWNLHERVLGLKAGSELQSSDYIATESWPLRAKLLLLPIAENFSLLIRLQSCNSLAITMILVTILVQLHYIQLQSCDYDSKLILCCNCLQIVLRQILKFQQTLRH